MRDFAEGFRWMSMWTMLAWVDVRQRYRRSVLGPLWLTVTMAIMVFALGYLYADLFNVDVHDYMPYVAGGIIVWTLLASFVNDGCQVFISNERSILNTRLPFSIYIYRLVTRNLIILAHNGLVFVAVAVAFRIEPTHQLWLAALGLFLVLVNGAWLALALGMMSLRFRDLRELMTTFMGLAVFITPVFWMPEILDAKRAAFALWNPFYHLLELVRAPLLGSAPDAASWWVGGAMAVLGWGVALSVFARYRRQIVFWF